LNNLKLFENWLNSQFLIFILKTKNALFFIVLLLVFKDNS